MNRKTEPATYRLSKNPYTNKVLDISTGHITKKDDDLLNREDEVSSIIVYDYPEGYFVYVPQDNLDTFLKELEQYGFSEEFRNILNRASNLKCKYVQFDCDGITYEDLPTFDW